MIAAKAIRASGFLESSMARAPEGTSNAPGTRATITSATFAPRRRSVSSEAASIASVIVGFQRAHTIPKRKPRASRLPSKCLGEKAAVARRGARMLKDRSSLKRRHCNPDVAGLGTAGSGEESCELGSVAEIPSVALQELRGRVARRLRPQRL